MKATLHIRLRAVLPLLLVLFANALFAQVSVSHKAGWFYIPDSLSLNIQGSLSSLEDIDLPLANAGKMYISDSISCYGDYKIFGDEPDSTAYVYLNGDTTQLISGTKDIRFGHLNVQNTYDSIELKTNVEIYNDIQLQQGNVYIHDFITLDLTNTGNLIGERNSARVFGGNYGEMKIARPLMFGQTYANIGGIGFGLTINGNLGTSTEITRKNVSQVNVSNGSINRFYTFKPEKNAYVSKPIIYYLDTIELEGNAEEELNLYASSTNGNTWVNIGGQVNTATDIVEGTNTEPFVLSDQTMLSLAEQTCLAGPYLEFAKDTIPLCGGESAWIRPEGIAGMSSVWSNGSENEDSILVDSEGVYYVTITNIYGCSTVDSVVVINAPNPNVKFAVTPVCVGSVSAFENQSTIASGQLTYDWDLGDLYTEVEDTSSLENPTITYQNQGVFNVKLTATSNYGCVSETEQTALVNAFPEVAFAMANNCADSVVQFDNMTTVFPDTTIDYTWDFGDDLSSADSTPIHSYASAGSYQVQLTANALGCESVISQEITIHPNPVAIFSAENVCHGQEIQFENQSISPSVENSYQWQFEDDNTAVLENPTYSFEDAGDYSISLHATTDQGCSHDTSMIISVHALPQPSFTASETCETKAMQFTNAGEVGSTYNWDFNSEGTDDEPEPEFTFADYGEKQVLLTETDSNGCVASFSKNIVVKAMPKVEFISTNGCQGEALTFRNNSTIADGHMDYDWYVDNSLVDDSEDLSNRFDQAGNYIIKLVVDNNGCTDSIEYATSIYETAKLDLGTSISTCADEYVLDALNEGCDYAWSDASASQQLKVVNSGTYWVQLTTDEGCVTRDTIEVELKTTVKPNIGTDALFCDETELDAGYPGATYEWSTGETTQHISISASDDYWIKITDQNGCVGADTIEATVVSSVVPNLGSDQTACEGDIITLESGSDTYTYAWNTGATSADLNVAETGTFWCQLTDDNGCVSSDTVAILIHKNPQVDLGADQHYCDVATFDIRSNNLSYQWENGLENGERAIYESGMYWAQVTDEQTGCSTTDTVTLSLSTSPEVDLGDDVYLCNGQTVLLDAQNMGNAFVWNVGALTATVEASATGNYIVDVTTPNGCVASDTVAVTIDDPLDTYLGEDFILCNNTKADISSPLSGASDYSWFLNDSALNINEQTITLSQQGVLSLSVLTEKGCTVNDTIELLTSPTELHANYLSATSDIYVGDTILFVNMSEPEPYSSYWDFGDGYFANSKAPEHTYYYPGEYRALLEIDNGVCADSISKLLHILPQPIYEEEEPEDQNKIISLNAFPNPASDEVNLEFTLKYDDEVYIECINVYGISMFNDVQHGAYQNVNYQVSSFMPGIYLFRVSIADQTMFIKLIKN